MSKRRMAALAGLVWLALGGAFWVLSAAPSALAQDAARSSAPAAGPIQYWQFSPLATNLLSTTNVTFYIQTAGVSSAYITLTSGTVAPLSYAGGGRFTRIFTHADIVAGYSAADANHNFVGYLNVYTGTTKLGQFNLFQNIVDGSVPPVTPVISDVEVQSTPHLVNLYLPGLYPDTMDDQYVAQHFYAHFADDYDFLSIIYTPAHFANRFHYQTRNSVSGIGLSIFDNDAAFGVPGMHRLKGITVYPITSYFDLAERGSQHEIGHQWINFLHSSQLLGVTPHWPVSSLAYGIMGWGVTQGLDFPYTFTPLGGGAFRLDAAPVAPVFNDMELYLMGLAPSTSVGTYYVAVNQNTPQCNGCIVTATIPFNAGNAIASDGPRSPAYPFAQRKFRVATIVVSQNFLSSNEMAFLDYMAARGSALSPLPYSSGFDSGTTYPFYLATGRRGCLITTIATDGNCYSLYAPLINR